MAKAVAGVGVCHVGSFWRGHDSDKGEGTSFACRLPLATHLEALRGVGAYWGCSTWAQNSGRTAEQRPVLASQRPHAAPGLPSSTLLLALGMETHLPPLPNSVGPLVSPECTWEVSARKIKSKTTLKTPQKTKEIQPCAKTYEPRGKWLPADPGQRHGL